MLLLIPALVLLCQHVPDDEEEDAGEEGGDGDDGPGDTVSGLVFFLPHELEGEVSLGGLEEGEGRGGGRTGPAMFPMQ